jgi:hypothetical protein
MMRGVLCCVVLRSCSLPEGLAGTLPEALAALTSLVAFEVRGSNLSGQIPPSFFAAWINLEVFSIQGANLTGPLPAPWNCTQLSTYVVIDTPVTSGLLGSADQLWLLRPEAGNLTQLRHVRLGEWLRAQLRQPAIRSRNASPRLHVTCRRCLHLSKPAALHAQLVDEMRWPVLCRRDAADAANLVPVEDHTQT